MKKLLLLFTAVIFSCNYANALPMQGSVSQDYDLGFETVIKRKFGEIIERSKTFEKNDDIFYQKRFKPVYMLSMHELYSLVPTLKSNIEKRKIPNTYNLSLNAQNSESQSNINLSRNNLEQEIANIAELEKTANIDTVQEKYEELISQNPDRIEISYKYAQYLYQNQKYREAISVLKTITEKDSSFVLASYTLGNIYYDLGEYKNAISANLEVIKKNPFCADAYYNIASSLEKMHKFNLAMDYYQKCLSLNANDTQAQDAVRRLEQGFYNLSFRN